MQGKTEANMEKTDWQSLAGIVICAAAAVALAWISVKYLLWVFLPFIIGWLVALIVTPAARFAEKKTKLPFRLCAVVILIAVIVALISGITAAVNRLILELEHLLETLMNDGGQIVDNVTGFVGRLGDFLSRIPLLGRLAGTDEIDGVRRWLTSIMKSFIGEMVGKLGGTLPGVVFGLISNLPSFLLALLVTLISAFYLVLDHERINNALASLLPQRLRGMLDGMKTKVFGALLRLGRAYFLLFLLTFGELLLGLVILGADYALLIALVGALVDLLPVFGTGIILIPWAVWSLFSGEIFFGIGIIVLYAVITVVRQIAEPHILGGSFGLHPLLTLFAIYCGFRLFGVAGMILLPMLTMLIFGTTARRNVKND